MPDHEMPDGRETVYQFENALWIGFHGGYGMFVDNLDAQMPTNSDERWLRNSNHVGEFGLYDDYMLVETTKGPRLIDDPEWKPEYKEPRILPGQPDYEAVLCHECAHEMCVLHPWMERLINSHSSHAHRTEYHERFPQHGGWDYDRRASGE